MTLQSHTEMFVLGCSHSIHVYEFYPFYRTRIASIVLVKGASRDRMHVHTGNAHHAHNIATRRNSDGHLFVICNHGSGVIVKLERRE
jgi:hypothetical protein